MLIVTRDVLNRSTIEVVASRFDGADTHYLFTRIFEREELGYGSNNLDVEGFILEWADTFLSKKTAYKLLVNVWNEEDNKVVNDFAIIIDKEGN